MSRRLAPALIAAATACAAVLIAWHTGPSYAASQEDCRPDGLYRTPGVDAPYCQTFDTNGREKMGAGVNRRVIGYFTSWRDGANGTPSYLVNNIPWNKVTHLNYAFAHIDGSNKVSVGSPGPKNASIGETWPGVPGAEMDPAFPYQGHFNLLNKFKKQYPNVKTLISVGGWAETGGYFDDNGVRQASGGFYAMTDSQATINTFADSAVAFIKQYGFDGVDIDYEYASSMTDSGNPADFSFSNPRRAKLMAGYANLMRTLRQKLDTAAAADGKYYQLTAAVPASGWLLRGMDTYQVTQYLDYLNMMSYDLHGAWNEYVGPNAALFDNGQDAELAAGGVYSTYGGLGYLNTDWAAHYFRGSMPAGRINLGLPFYTRGWEKVTGGTNGLWGDSKGTNCPPGTTICGAGAVGIDNVWHDSLANGQEEPAGGNPMWHAKNLENGIAGSYRAAYGLDLSLPKNQLSGTYVRNYNATMATPWLWNDAKKVFLSTEDEQSVAAKAQYIADSGFGGAMFWELAGDYKWDTAKGEYGMGSTLTTALYDKLQTAGPYGATKAARTMPTTTMDVGVDFGGFPVGDNNYPITGTATITNRSAVDIPGSSKLEFDVPVTTTAEIGNQSGWTIAVTPGRSGGNSGGLKADFHHVTLTMPSWQTIAKNGGTATVVVTWKLPISGPSNYILTFGGASYRLSADYPRGGPAQSPSPSASPTKSPTPSPSASPTKSPTPSPSASPTKSPTASPSPTVVPTGGGCTAAAWNSTAVYTGGQLVSYAGHMWKAKWWTQSETPGVAAVWADQGACTGGTPTTAPPGTCVLPAWNATATYNGGDQVSYTGHKYKAKWWTQNETPGVAQVWEDLGAC